MTANGWLRSIVLMVLMLATSCLAIALKPTQRLADQGPKVDLEAMIPSRFGDWSELPQNGALIVDPGQAELIGKIYTQTLSRTYVNTRGAIVMLSIAYGSNQNDGLALHYPEVCYPAQGFAVSSKKTGALKTHFGSIPVKRLLTALGNRNEPVTYWTTLGNKVVLGGLDTRIAHLRYGLNDLIPDGMLVRFSSIDDDPERAFALQEAFAAELLSAVSKDSLPRIAGVDAGQTSSR